MSADLQSSLRFLRTLSSHPSHPSIPLSSLRPFSVCTVLEYACATVRNPFEGHAFVPRARNRSTTLQSLTMTTMFQRDLKKKQRHLVQLIRPGWMSDVFGFVVDANASLVLVHSFKNDAFCLSGYEVVRQRDIRAYCFFDDPRYWRFRALRKLKIRPTAPIGISIASIPALLASVGSRFPLLSVHHETRRKEVTYIGPIVSLGKRIFTIEDADYYGEWTGPRRMRYEDVTTVIFDDGYLKASAMTSKRIPWGKIAKANKRVTRKRKHKSFSPSRRPGR